MSVLFILLVVPPELPEPGVSSRNFWRGFSLMNSLSISTDFSPLFFLALMSKLLGSDYSVFYLFLLCFVDLARLASNGGTTSGSAYGKSFPLPPVVLKGQHFLTAKKNLE